MMMKSRYHHHARLPGGAGPCDVLATEPATVGGISSRLGVDWGSEWGRGTCRTAGRTRAFLVGDEDMGGAGRICLAALKFA